MNIPVRKFAKGFVVGGAASLVAVLGSAGCSVRSLEDVKALGIAVVTGLIAGGLHAVSNLVFGNNV